MSKKAVKWLSRGTSTVEEVLFKQAKGIISKGMINIMRCRYSRIPKALEVMEAYFEKLGSILETQPFLCGADFTAADLTFACLSYPLIFPVEFEDVMMGIHDLPLEYQKIVTKFRGMKAGQHAMRMYREHRFPPGTVDKRMVKPNLKRDDYLYPGIVGILGGFLLFVYAMLKLTMMLIFL